MFVFIRVESWINPDSPLSTLRSPFPVPRSPSRPVHHPARELMQKGAEAGQVLGREAVVADGAIEDAVEASEPFLARHLIDGEWQVARPQHRRAITLLIKRRPTQ